MRKILVLGGPGAGKTEKLLRKVEAALENDVPPNRIAFVSFTRAAIEEAKRRACEAFSLIPDDLPNFRTVHSLAFRELGLRKDDVLSDAHLEAVSERTGELLTTLEDPFSDAPVAGKQADPLLTLDHFARTTGRDLETAWRDHGSQLEWHRLLRFSRAYLAYKDEEDVLDFTDMLTKAADLIRPLDVDLAIVDEGQDLSLAQWRVIERAFSTAETLIVAGDDMQMIHHWAGADEEKFLGLVADGYEIENLPLSHRLPREPFKLAEEVGMRISKRYHRAWRPSNRDGSVDWIADAGEADLSVGKDWLLLARTRAQLPGLAQAARDQGVVYSLKGENSVKWNDVVAIKAHEALRKGGEIGASDADALGKASGRSFEQFDGLRGSAALNYDAREIWHDALKAMSLDSREYYLSVMRRGGKLTDDPRVRIETIHGAKGAEAERVLLSTDMTYRTSRGMEIDPDAEMRVLYVGLTRVREALTLVAPKTQYGYRI